MSHQLSEAFLRIRPACIELSGEAFLPAASFNPQSTSLLNALRSVEHELEKLEENKTLAPAFADYVFVPIAHLLQHQGLGTSQTELVLLIIGHLLSLSWSSVGTFPLALAQQLFPLLTFLISNDKDNKELLAKPMEFQLAGCIALDRLFEALAVQKSNDVYNYFVDPKALPSLGHSVTILLDVLQNNDDNADVQLQAIRALHTLYVELLHDGEIISFILPGNVSAFSKLLLKPGLTVKSSVVCSTLRLFGALLSLVYSDTGLHIAKLPAPGLQQRLAETKETTVINRKIDESSFGKTPLHRNNKWLTATTGQVKTALEAVLPKLLHRESASIKKAVRELLETLLKSCHVSLSNCLELFIATSLDARVPPSVLVGSPENSHTLKRIVEKQISEFPRALQFESVDGLKRFGLAISAMEQQSDRDFEMIGRAVSVLQQSFSEYLEQKNLRFSERKVVEQSSLVIVGQELFTQTTQIQQLFPKVSKNLEDTLSELFQAIGSYCGKAQTDRLVTDLLTKSYADEAHGKAMGTWISSLLINGFTKQANATGDTMDEFLVLENESNDVPEACYMVLQSSIEILNSLSQNGHQITKNDELDAMVSLYAIKLMNDSMNAEFEEELIDLLFPVVDCLASSSPAIRNVAQVTTMDIARAHYGGSVRDLIWENMDYLIDAISTRLSNCMTQRIATLLMVICRIGGYDTIRSFKDVLETIFRLLDYYHGHEDLCIEFFQLFDIVVNEMAKRYLCGNESMPKLESGEQGRGGFQNWGLRNIQDVMRVLSELEKYSTAGNPALEEEDVSGPGNFDEFFNSKLREVDSDDEDDDDDDEDDDNGDDNEEMAESQNSTKESGALHDSEKWSSPIPRDSYRLLLQIAGYGDRLLTHESRALKVQILQLARHVFPMLATEYDMLLPQIAKSWDLIVHISMSADFSLVKPALECVTVMIKHSGDFVTKRFIDLWGAYKKDSALLQSVNRKQKNAGNMRVNALTKADTLPPNITTEALKSMAEMLLEGISRTELFISDVQLREMVYVCLLVLPAEVVASRSLILGDMVASCLV
ncbi:LAFA_0F07822g1_1 [Lachancea sp. 'fantastica']|nr:LAFA_0F07822g1_1 [Lachancea sp. 'fantastica']